MIIDLHTHTFPDKIAPTAMEKLRAACHTRPFSDGTAAGLEASMDEAGVDLSVVLPVATNTRQVSRVNDASAEINRQGGRILSFGCIHPDCEDWCGELERIARLGIKGIKLHPVYQGVDIDDVRYIRILARAGELGLVVVTHAGLDIGFPGQVNCTPAMLRRAVLQAGPVKLVAAHMGGWRNWDEVCQQLADTTVSLDTSYALGRIRPEGEGEYTLEELDMMGEEQFMAIVRTLGAQRICFGTDSPWRGQKESLADILRLPLSEEEKRAILGGNAGRLLGLGEEENGICLKRSSP